MNDNDQSFRRRLKIAALQVIAALIQLLDHHGNWPFL
jgi:hypothetical protein